MTKCYFKSSDKPIVAPELGIMTRQFEQIKMNEVSECTEDTQKGGFCRVVANSQS
jgi:hypothetical protein